MADISDERAAEEEIDQPLPDDQEQEGVPEERELQSRPLFRVIGIIFIALAVVVGVYGTVAYMAWQRSQDARAEEARSLLLQEIDDQLALAREDMAAGNFALARRRLAWILEREADHPETLALMRQIEVELALPTATPRPTPTEPASAGEEIPLDDELAADFARLQDLTEAGAWAEAISALVAFQSENPNYRRQDTDRLLYDAYVLLGQELLSGDQVELGLYYLSQAEVLGDLDQAVEDQRLWAELYLQGIAYYGVEWSTAATFFRDLCAAAPFYQNSCQKLRDSLIALGDTYAANLDWCPAQTYYAEAAGQNGDSALSEKLSNARLMCLEATPTPSTAITATGEISNTVPVVPGGGTGSEGGDG